MKIDIVADEEYRAENTDTIGTTFLVSWTLDAPGGTLRVWTENEGHKTPVPDSFVTIGELDNDGNERQQMIVQTKGAIFIEADGAAGTEVYVG